MINLKASRKTGTINVGVNPITNINVSNPAQAGQILNNNQYPNITDPNFPSVAPGVVDTSTINPTDPSMVSYKTPDELEKAALLREINVLRLIIELQHANPLIVNKYIITDDELLCKLVALLCNAREVHLDADDLGSGCITKKTYRKVNSIYVINENGETLNLKYDFPAVMKTLKDLHISTKFVF
jgi:hypothetical protein